MRYGIEYIQCFLVSQITVGGMQLTEQNTGRNESHYEGDKT